MQNLSWKVRLFILAGICYTKILAQTTHIDTVNVRKLQFKFTSLHLNALFVNTANAIRAFKNK